MNVLITGAGGLLGFALTHAVRRAGHRVTGIGRTAQPPPGLDPDAWIAGDLASIEIRRHDWSSVQGATVLHLAADTRVYAPGRDFLRDNVASAEAACEIARQTGGRLIHFSSSAVYSGPATQRPLGHLTEQSETAPVSAYGRSKLAAEAVVRRSGVPAVNLRLFGVLSERLAVVPDRGNLVQAILRAQRCGDAVTIAADAGGHPPLRDYVHEEDICRCVLALLEETKPAPAILNLCTGVATSAVDLVTTAALVTGTPIPIRFAPPTAAVNPVMVGAPAALKQSLGWVPPARVREFWQRLPTGRPASNRLIVAR